MIIIYQVQYRIFFPFAEQSNYYSIPTVKLRPVGLCNARTKNCVVYHLDEQVKAFALLRRSLWHWQSHPQIFLACMLFFSLVLHNLKFNRNQKCQLKMNITANKWELQCKLSHSAVLYQKSAILIGSFLIFYL